MQLPVLNHKAAPSPRDLIRLFCQTETRWTEHISEPASLPLGTAYSNPALHAVFDANCIRDVSLPSGMTPPQALALVDSHYARQATRCAYWVMNPDADPSSTTPLIQHLLSLGYTPRSADIMLLAHFSPSAAPESPGLTIIPARASFRHTQVLADATALVWNTPQLAQATMLHFDDPHWDALLALLDGTPAAHAGVLTVGEVGRIDEVYVAEAFRRRGIGQTIVSRVLEISARSLLKHVMLSTLSDNHAAIMLYQKLGFASIGQITAYCTPATRR